MLMVKWLAFVRTGFLNGIGTSHRSRRCRRIADGTPQVAAIVEQLESRQLLTAIVVNSTSDLPDAQLPAGSVTLRDAINKANSEGGENTISFASSLTESGPATIKLTQGVLTIPNSSLNISGPGPTSLTLIDGGWDGVAGDTKGSQIFNIVATKQHPRVVPDVTITGLSLLHANQGGAIENYENLTLSDDWISGNSGSTGGGIFNAGTLTMQDDVFRKRDSSPSGAQLYNTL